MRCCAIATEHHVSVIWGVDSPPEAFLEEMRKWPVMPRGKVTEDGKGVELSVFCEEEYASADDLPVEGEAATEAA